MCFGPVKRVFRIGVVWLGPRKPKLRILPIFGSQYELNILFSKTDDEDSLARLRNTEIERIKHFINNGIACFTKCIKLLFKELTVLPKPV